MVDEGAEGRPSSGGPPAWIILLVTAVAAALVVGGIVAYRAWRGGDDEPDIAAPAITAPATTVPGPAPEHRLFTRQTDAGIELRVDVQSAEDLGFELGPPVGADAPDACRVVSQATATAISADEVIQAFYPLTVAPPDEPGPQLLSSMMGFGGAMTGVIVQVPEDAVSTRLAVPGAFDEMAPVDGVAALVVPLAEPIDRDPRDPTAGLVDDLTLTVVGADGRRQVVRGNDLMNGPVVWRGVGPCMPDFEEVPPPPTASEEDNPFAVRLPPPGEQPADPAAAQAAIGEVMRTLYGAPAGPDVLALVDDPFAMRETFERIGEIDVGVEWADVAVDIEELVFLSPVEAAFEYTLRVPGGVEQDELFGRARIVDGTWRVGRGTICRDLQQTFATTCPP